jgi:ectoine hydroxylase-related dioxygenase (phytanoyl-CoA dioxygenase family)
MDEVNCYGVTEITQVETEIDLVVEELHLNGYAVLPNVLAPEQVAYYRTALDRIYQAQIDEVGGEENLARINDADVIRCPLLYDEAFLDLATHPAVMDVARRLLGPAFVLMMQNGVSNQPDAAHFQTRWHRDLNYQHWTSSRPLAFQALYCLDPFTEQTGATWMLPGTHMSEPFPSKPYVLKHGLQALAEPGSIIFANAMIFHRAGENRSGRVRRGVNHVIGLPFMNQQIDIARGAQGRWSEDPFLAEYLGYRWNPKSDVASWRREKLQASGAPR